MKNVIGMINKIRKDQGVMLKDLAAACGVSTGQMSRYLNGESKIPYDVVRGALGVLGYDLMVVLK